MKVLIVDDEKTIRGVLKNRITRCRGEILGGSGNSNFVSDCLLSLLLNSGISTSPKYKD